MAGTGCIGPAPNHEVVVAVVREHRGHPACACAVAVAACRVRGRSDLGSSPCPASCLGQRHSNVPALAARVDRAAGGIAQKWTIFEHASLPTRAERYAHSQTLVVRSNRSQGRAIERSASHQRLVGPVHSPSTCNSENSRERRAERGSRRRALRSTCPRDALPTKLHQPANNSLYKGLMGSDDRRKAGGSWSYRSSAASSRHSMA